MLLDRWKRYFGKDFIEKILNWKEKVFIRVNTLKIGREKLLERLEKKGFKLKPLEFYEDGFEVLEQPYSIGATLEYLLGYYYIQSASSMIPPLVLNPKPNEFVIDGCAAPGSKTTQIAQLMNNKGVIIAIDSNKERMRALRSNLQRMGIKNTIAVKMDFLKFPKSKKLTPDKILLDVPCTGTGNLKYFDNVKNISEAYIKKMSVLQKRLLAKAIKIVKEGGEIVYSTCSFEPEENEFVINWALKRYNIELLDIGIKIGQHAYKGFGKIKFKKEIRKARRIIEPEGFFIARLRKCSGK